MKQLLLIGLLASAPLLGHAQAAKSFAVPPKALAQLEEFKEQTKRVASGNARKGPAEARPELNRLLVLAADDFVRATTGTPSREAYLQSMDTGLARLAPLATTAPDRRQVAEFYQDLMEMVGLDSSDGRLDAFVSQLQAQK